jgi:hypothetical protein
LFSTILPPYLFAEHLFGVPLTAPVQMGSAEDHIVTKIDNRYNLNWSAQRKVGKIVTLTSHCKKHLSSIKGHHWLRSQFISFKALTLKQGSRQRRTTTLSVFADINPRRNTLRHPQL